MGANEAGRGAKTAATEQRIVGFAHFLKNYMSASAVVTAALPIPITKLGLIPTYSAMTSLLSAYTSLFCFLLLGFIFNSRHALARLMFPDFVSRATPSVESSKSSANPELLIQRKRTRLVNGSAPVAHCLFFD